ncbi:MAG: hypothetical protein CMQ34_09880 [Gammaproteobacteria bacterium]|nr:hypothetical protein [Gammaproteobacteria bacterium]|tara:strand:- start:420 stop:686 length:267 start_codon:yes stop_codon:yes gene_type:complete
MTFTDKRKRSRLPSVEPDLLDQGIIQLNMEIQILSDWLKNLDADDKEQQISYRDMLQSRREMLRSLELQKAELDTARQSRSTKPPPKH